MACPAGTIEACAFGQWLVNETPVFDEAIIEDITPTDGWIGNVSTHSVPIGTPPEITQDRFRTVVPNTARPWTRTLAPNSCLGNPCDPSENEIGWGSDRLTYFEEEQTWVTPLLCFDQLILVTHAKEQLANIISETLKPAVSWLSSAFLRKTTLFWSKQKLAANALMTPFSYVWTLNALGDQAYFDTSVAPSAVFKLVPQMLQNLWAPLMRIGYAGKNPFKDTAPFVELVTDMSTTWELDHLGGSQGVGGTPSISGNWRFTEWGAANDFWRYGFSGQIGNYLVRVDEFGLRFNFVQDLGAAAAPNRYRYQIVLPYRNEITTGAGSSAGIGRDSNPDYDRAQYALSFISHKMGLSLGIRDARPINPEMPFLHPNFAGEWRFLMNNLGADRNGLAINNKWGNKGQFGARMRYMARPEHPEFLVSLFHKREQFCIPEIQTCSTNPGYPAQSYNSALPKCPIPSAYDALYGTGVPSGTQDGLPPEGVPS